MNPLLKKALAALAIKEGIEKIQEMRQPKRRSIGSRLGPLALMAGVGAGTYVLAKNGKLQPLLDKAKALTGGDKAAPRHGQDSGTSQSSINLNDNAPSSAPIG
jgi:hypothetical protein